MPASPKVIEWNDRWWAEAVRKRKDTIEKTRNENVVVRAHKKKKK